MEIIFHGHACFEVKGDKGRILIDPFLNGNPAAIISPDHFTDLSAILVTHGHSDHLGDALEISRRTKAPIIAVVELARLCAEQGVETHGMQIGGKYHFDFGTVRLTQALHGSTFETSKGPQYAGLACGFLIKMDEKWLYHAGDTGLFGDMELIGKRHPIEVAMLPIGDNYTMGPEEAVYAANLLRAKRVIPMHYNTFPLIKQDEAEFTDQLSRKFPESEGVILQVGQSLVL